MNHTLFLKNRNAKLTQFAVFLFALILSTAAVAQQSSDVPSTKNKSDTRHPDSTAVSHSSSENTNVLKKWSGVQIQVPAFDAEFKIRGLLQAESIFFSDDSLGQTNRFQIRRARIALDGKVGKHVAFRIQPQWTSSDVVLLDGYVDILFVGELALRAGRMKTPLGIEMSQSAAVLLLPERGLTTALVPNRDMGAQLFGEVGKGVFNYIIGLGNGVPDQGTSTANDDSDFDGYGKLFVQPFYQTEWTSLQKLGFGLAASLGRESANESSPSLSRYRTGAKGTFAEFSDGIFADGKRWRLNPQLWWYAHSCGILSEYVYSRQRVRSETEVNKMANQGWMVGVSYVLTQEDASYTGIVPSRKAGAFELTARYSELHLDDTVIDSDFFVDDTPRISRALGVGLNYWALAIMRAQLAFEQTRFTGSTPTENAIYLRLQVSM